jgi:hypothetical protein
MNRDTLKYISRRTRGDSVGDTEYRNPEQGAYNPAYPEYDEHRISARYGDYTNTYRAEGVVEGVFEKHPSHDRHSGKILNPIGFNSKPERKSKQDFMYELEESLEKTIDDLMYYSELAMEAETKKFSEFADAFYEIAKCNMSCAESLHHRLMMYGYDPHKQSEIEDRFDRAKHAFRRL